MVLGDKTQKESPRISVGENRVVREITLAHQPVVEVGMKKLREVRTQ
jgi:hypothetical protein